MSTISNTYEAPILQAKIDLPDQIREERERLFGFIRKQVHDVHEAEDLVQDVMEQFLKASSAQQSFDDSIAWIYRVARNKITDLFRKKRPIAMSSYSTNQEAWKPEMTSPDGIGALMERDAFYAAFEDALSKLPIKQRWTFEQHEMEGRSFQELAEETGEKVGTLIARKRYAVLHLRKQLKHLYDEMVLDQTE